MSWMILHFSETQVGHEFGAEEKTRVPLTDMRTSSIGLESRVVMAQHMLIRVRVRVRV